jgi:hypothetical protein
MKVSHELPIELLNKSYQWNDYDYCLPHLIDKSDRYRLFFQKARLDKRFIIMDNGLFEGVTHTTEDLFDKINLIRPNVFIVPDEWNNSAATLRNAKHWMINYKDNLPEGVELMAVCQGKNIGELLTTYQTLVDLGYKHIALNHSSIAYTEFYPNYPKLQAQMLGRIELVRRLIESNTVRESVYHHLLGVALPQEIMAYSRINWIKSVDTSNPIIVGYKGVRYEDNGIEFKPTEKIEELNEVDLDPMLDDIIFNINKFKQFIK